MVFKIMMSPVHHLNSKTDENFLAADRKPSFSFLQ